MQIDRQQITEQLLAELPVSLAPQAEGLARMLCELASAELDSAAAQARLDGDPQLRNALRALSGRELAQDSALIRFGEGAQSGDITIGDVAGRDLIKLNLVLALGPRRREQIVLAGVQATVIVAALVAIGLLFWRQLQAPPRMSGLFNIAVAEFGARDADGSVTSWAASPALSDSIVSRLTEEFAAIPALRGKVSIRNQAVGRVEGNSSAERAAQAAALAERIGADVLIYGDLKPGHEPTFTPEFFLRSAILPEAEELTGEGQLGTPIAVSQGFGGNFLLSDKLSIRVDALARFTVALVQLTEHQPAKAAQALEELSQLEGWDDAEGKEVVYLFLGTAYFALFAENNDLASLGRADQAYQRAVQLNPNYARGYVGVGNVAYERYVRADKQEPLLDQALLAYQQAADAADKPSGSLVMEKIHISLGNVYVSRAQRGHKQDFRLAEAEYNAVREPFEQGRAELKHLAAFAYCGLGVVAERGNGATTEALRNYQRCYELADDERLRALATAQLSALAPLATAQTAPDSSAASTATVQE